MALWWQRILKCLLWALAGLGAVVLILFVLWGGPWLLTRHPSQGLTAEQELTAKSDVRTTLVQAVGGLAVAGGLIVTYRTYRQNQRDQVQRWAELDRTYQLNQRDQEKRWAEQERPYDLNVAAQVTDTYTRAVEQLGHDEAPVRLGALHSLVKLAQDNVPRRQTVVDVLCAYLRMPYTPPSRREPTAGPALPAAAASPAGADREKLERDSAQELQVRQTAQRLLADHLRPPAGIAGEDAQSVEGSPEESFWPGVSLDLTGAGLVDLDMTRISAVRATFREATFFGSVSFNRAAFSGIASFYQTTFLGFASFNKATFYGRAWFSEATFCGEAWFSEARFFRRATFHKALFSGDTSFNKATFYGYAEFRWATVSAGALFSGATFSGRVELRHVSVLRLDDLHPRREWPDGWTVAADVNDRTRGTLVPSAGFADSVTMDLIDEQDT
jgi:uncharacterized protein YjbI with pentapeptide repeats